MSTQFGSDNVFMKPAAPPAGEQSIPGPPERIPPQQNRPNAATRPAHNVITMDRSVQRDETGLPGTAVGQSRQVNCNLSPKVAAATRRAELDYGTLGAVLVHALYETREQLVEHFTQQEGNQESVESTNGFVLPSKKRARRRKARNERIAFLLSEVNAQQLGVLMDECGVGARYSQLCNEALRRFFDIPEESN